MKGIKLMLIKVSSVTLVLRQRKDPSVTFTYEATGYDGSLLLISARRSRFMSRKNKKILTSHCEKAALILHLDKSYTARSIHPFVGSYPNKWMGFNLTIPMPSPHHVRYVIQPMLHQISLGYKD